MDVYQQISSNNRRTVLILLLFFITCLAITGIVMLFLEAPMEVFPFVSIGLFIIIFIWTLISYFFGDKMITKFVGAKPINRKEHFEIYNLVHNVAIAAGLPNPKVYIIKDESLNAFATGRNPEHGIICLTTGIIKKLNKNELEAVIAHELGHIANYDIRLQLILITVIGVVAIIGEVMMRARGKKAGGVILAGAIVYLIGRPILNLIMLAMSRNREYLADATGSLYTRNPDALASALEKISQDSRIESADRMNSAAHLFIANPKNEPRTESKKALKQESFLTRVFSTHPPIGERISRLRSRG